MFDIRSYKDMMVYGGNPLFLFIEIVRALKNAENHTFAKLTKFAKLQYFKTFYFKKVNHELIEIYLIIAYHYCTLYNKNKIVVMQSIFREISVLKMHLFL